MNEIKVKISFEKRTLEQEGVNLTEGDYNSTKIIFEFDKEYEGIKVFELAKPDTTEAIFVSEIINNEVILTAYKDGNPVSIFDEEGKYIYEISLYDDSSKLTSMRGKLRVNKEMVKIGDEIAEHYLPVFDQLIQEVNRAIDRIDILNIDSSKEGTTTTITITRKDGTMKTVEILDGRNGKDGLKGEDGYTPIKGIDYFDGRDGVDGRNGADGRDGYTPIKGVDYFDGQNGNDGYTPIKGTDYWTITDKQEIIEEVLNSLPNAEEATF